MLLLPENNLHARRRTSEYSSPADLEVDNNFQMAKSLPPVVLQVTFHSGGRNVTISVPSHNALIKFRFTGHADIRKNFGGVNTFTEPAWLADYDCMVENPGPGCAPKHPDYVIINSGAHDAYPPNAPGPLNEFAEGMQSLALWLAKMQSRLKTKVIWRGNNGWDFLHAYEIIAKSYIQSTGLAYLDVESIFQSFAADLKTTCCSDLHAHGLHVGVIGRYSTKGNAAGSRITVSSMVTQGLLSLMFSEAHNTDCSQKRIYRGNRGIGSLADGTWHKSTAGAIL